MNEHGHSQMGVRRDLVHHLRQLALQRVQLLHLASGGLGRHELLHDFGCLLEVGLRGVRTHRRGPRARAPFRKCNSGAPLVNGSRFCFHDAWGRPWHLGSGYRQALRRNRFGIQWTVIRRWARLLSPSTFFFLERPCVCGCSFVSRLFFLGDIGLRFLEFDFCHGAGWN